MSCACAYLVPVRSIAPCSRAAFEVVAQEDVTFNRRVATQLFDDLGIARTSRLAQLVQTYNHGATISMLR